MWQPHPLVTTDIELTQPAFINSVCMCVCVCVCDCMCVCVTVCVCDCVTTGIELTQSVFINKEGRAGKGHGGSFLWWVAWHCKLQLQLYASLTVCVTVCV
jgi:hypothetical protein